MDIEKERGVPVLIDKSFLIIAVLYFVLLYVVAFLANYHYRDKNDILWISRHQWKAIFIMWIPVIFAMIDWN